MKKNTDVKKIWDVLQTIDDPELGISLVDLGLIYEVKINGNKVEILMTLTSIGCPLFPVMEQEIIEKINKLGYEKVGIELTFDPPWNMDRMSESAKAMLGI